MAEVGRLTRARPGKPWLTPVTLLRAAIVLAVLVIWQLMAVSGWFYRGVLPSLPAVWSALEKLLLSGDFYWNLGVTGERDRRRHGAWRACGGRCRDRHRRQ